MGLRLPKNRNLIYFAIGAVIALMYRRAVPFNWPIWGEILSLVVIAGIVWLFLKWIDKPSK